MAVSSVSLSGLQRSSTASKRVVRLRTLSSGSLRLQTMWCVCMHCISIRGPTKRGFGLTVPSSRITNTHLQAHKLINPSNPKAIGSDGNAKGVGGDTVDGVRVWSSKLAAALKGVNPAPVIVDSDSQEASQPPMRIELTIEGYRSAGQGNTVPPAA